MLRWQGRRYGQRRLAAQARRREYEAAFRDNKVDDTVLPSLTAEDLKELRIELPHSLLKRAY